MILEFGSFVLSLRNRTLFFALLSIIVIVIAVLDSENTVGILQFALPATWGFYFYSIIVDWVKANINLIWVYIAYLLGLFFAYIFIDEAFIDEMVAVLLIWTIVFDIIYRLINLFQAKVLKKTDYFYRYLLFTGMPCLLLFIIVQVKNHDMEKFNARLDDIAKDAITACQQDECVKSMNITEGSTTILLRPKTKGNCTELNSYFSFAAIRSVTKCIDADGQVITK